jgi:excisionase family DNA binding protein
MPPTFSLLTNRFTSPQSPSVVVDELLASSQPRRFRTRRSDMSTWFKVPQAAQYAGVSRDTVYGACARGELRHVRVAGRRAIRLKPEWMDEWLERYERATQARTMPQRAA